MTSQDVIWLKKTYEEWKGLQRNNTRLDPEDEGNHEFINPNANDPKDL
jgi:hypothetical protein